MADFFINDKEYIVKQELNKTDDYTRYLVEWEGMDFIAKHFNPQDARSFLIDGNKVQKEVTAFFELSKIFIPLSPLHDYSLSDKLIVKEFIPGDVAADLLQNKKMTPDIYREIFRIAHLAESFGFILDYDPCNYIWSNGVLYYTKYSFKKYDESKCFKKYGLGFWIPRYESLSLELKAMKRQEYIANYGAKKK